MFKTRSNESLWGLFTEEEEAILEKLGWQFVSRMETFCPEWNPRLNADALNSSTKAFWGLGFIIWVNSKERICTVEHFSKELIGRPGWTSCRSSIIFAVIGEIGSLERLNNLDTARTWVSEVIRIEAAEQTSVTKLRYGSKPGDVIDLTVERDQQRSFKNSIGYDHFVDLVIIHGWEALNISLTKSQAAFLAASKDIDAAKQYVRGLMRLECVSEKDGKRLLIGNIGCPDYELDYYENPGRYRVGRPVEGRDQFISLMGVFPDLPDRILAELTAAFALVGTQLPTGDPYATSNQMAIVVGDIYYCRVQHEGQCIKFEPRNGDPVSIPENEVFCLSLWGAATEGMLVDHNGESIASQGFWSIGVIVPRLNPLGVYGARGSRTKHLHDFSFMVPKGESANFFLLHEFEGDGQSYKACGLKVSRDKKGKYAIERWQPTQQIVGLNAHRGSIFLLKLT